MSSTSTMELELRKRFEVVKLQNDLEMAMHSVHHSYNRLTIERDATVNRLQKEIKPLIERSNRDARVLGVCANAGFLAGGILSGVGILATPLTAGASLMLTTAGATLFCAGGATAVGAGVANYLMTKMNFDEAKELLVKFRQLRQELCEKLLRVYEILEMIAGMRSKRMYEAIVNKLFPEYSATFKSATFLLENFQIAQLFDIMASSNGGVNVAKGVYEFVNFVEKLAKKGQKITKTVVTKFLIPLGIVLDSAFLIASIHELRKNKKCKAATIVELIGDIIEEEMRAIDDLCPTLRSETFWAAFPERAELATKRMFSQISI